MSQEIQLTIGFVDPQLEDEDKSRLATSLIRDLQESDTVERAYRTENLDIEDGARPGFATLIGFLTAEVTLENLKSCLSFLNERLQDKTCKLKIKMGENEVEIEASSIQELEKMEALVQKLQSSMSQ